MVRDQAARLSPAPAGHIETFVRNVDEVALNPQPLPPSPETAAYLWQAVRLYQYGNLLTAAKVPGNVAEALLGEAARIYDDGECGTVPWNIILQWLRHPPPPPPRWLDVVAQAATNVLIANKLGGDIGKQLLGAAVSVIQGEIGQVKARTRSAAA
jgi:hypothetical protein